MDFLSFTNMTGYECGKYFIKPVFCVTRVLLQLILDYIKID